MTGADSTAQSSEASSGTRESIALVSARFQRAQTEAKFQRANIAQTRFVVSCLAVLAVIGALASGHGTYLTFGDHWITWGGGALRLALVALCLIAIGVYVRSANPTVLYAWNAVTLALACAVVALRMTSEPAAPASTLALFHVSRDGMSLLLIAALAVLLLVPGWFLVNTAILASALCGFVAYVLSEHGTAAQSLNLAYVSVVGFLFIVAMGNMVQRLRRHSYLAHERLREANAELMRLATTDVLTDCANRRHFLSVAASELERSRRFRHPLSVIILDVDHFKTINDRFGHAAGDRTLQALVDLINADLRDSDVLGRLGGEELALLLPETTIADAGRIAERLCQRIAESLGREITVTASFGVAEASEADTVIDDVINRADAAMFRAKARGRNCVEHADWPARLSLQRQPA